MKKLVSLAIVIAAVALLGSFPRSQTAPLRIDLILPDGRVMIYAGQKEGIQRGNVFAVKFHGENIGRVVVTELMDHSSIAEPLKGSQCLREWDELELTDEKVEKIEKEEAAKAAAIQRAEEKLAVKEVEEQKQEIEEEPKVAAETAPPPAVEKKVEKAPEKKKEVKPEEKKPEAKEKPAARKEEEKPKEKAPPVEEKIEEAAPAPVEEKAEEAPAEEAKATCPAKVVAITGTVEVMMKSKGSDKWSKAELNQCVEVGDMVRTRDEGLAALGFGDNPQDLEAQVNMNKDSTVTITEF